jgi:hypothetical protein
MWLEVWIEIFEKSLQVSKRSKPNKVAKPKKTNNEDKPNKKSRKE